MVARRARARTLRVRPSASRYSRGSCTRPARSITANSSAPCSVPSSRCRACAAPRCSCGRRGWRRCAHLPAHLGVVGDDHDGGAELTVDRAQGGEHLRAVSLSSSPVGSSASSTRGPVGERDRDRHALLLAAGHLVGPAVGAVRHPEELEQLGRPVVALPAGHPGDASSGGRRSAVASGRAPGCGRSAAGRTRPRGAGSAPARARDMSIRSCPATRARPAVGDVDAGQHRQQRRLARAGGADDRDHLAVVAPAGRGPAAPAPRRPRTGRCAPGCRTRRARRGRTRGSAAGEQAGSAPLHPFPLTSSAAAMLAVSRVTRRASCVPRRATPRRR